MQIRAENSIQYENNDIKEGSVFCANSIVTSNIKIGRFFQMNVNSYLAHDCVVGNFVTFAPHVCCCGYVVIEDFVHVGAGAVIKQGTKDRPIIIGEGATIGIGAIVTKSVEPYTTVVGNPARPI